MAADHAPFVDFVRHKCFAQLTPCALLQRLVLLRARTLVLHPRIGAGPHSEFSAAAVAGRHTCWPYAKVAHPVEAGLVLLPADGLHRSGKLCARASYTSVSDGPSKQNLAGSAHGPGSMGRPAPMLMRPRAMDPGNRPTAASQSRMPGSLAFAHRSRPVQRLLPSRRARSRHTHAPASCRAHG